MDRIPRYSDMIWPELIPLMDRLTEAGVRQGFRQNVLAQARRAKETTDKAAQRLATLRDDTDLSHEAKGKRAQAVVTDALPELEAAQTEVENLITLERAYHETRAAWPRSEGSSADREARLTNARADLHRLIDNTPTGRRAERLAFAARTGSDAMRELIFAEHYPETVLWPSLPDGQFDAMDWTTTRTRLLREHHPGGDTAMRSLDALDALNGNTQSVSGERIGSAIPQAITYEQKYLNDTLQTFIG